MPANPSPTYAKPPAPPAPPPTKIIKEGWGKDFCKVCSSSVNHSFLGTYLGCIQPKCSEYFEKTTKPKWTGMPIRNYETKLTHFVYFSDFDKDKNPPFEEIRKEIELMRTYMESNGVKVWTDDINDAETWDNHSIREYSKYYPELEMVNVYVHIA